MKLVLAISLTLICAGCAPSITGDWLPVVNYSVAGQAPFNTLQGKSIVTGRPAYLTYGTSFDSPQKASPQRDRLYDLSSQPPWGSGCRFVLAAGTKLLVTNIRHYRQLTGVFDEPINFNGVFFTVASGPFSGVKAMDAWEDLPDLQSPPTKH